MNNNGNNGVNNSNNMMGNTNGIPGINNQLGNNVNNGNIPVGNNVSYGQRPDLMGNVSNLNNSNQYNNNYQSTGQNFSSLNNKKTIICIGAVVAAVVICLAVYVIFGNKTLKCTIDESTSGMEMSSTITFEFNKDTIKRFDMLMEMEVDDEYIEQKDELIEILEGSYDEFEEYGADVNVYSKKNKVYIEIGGNSNKLSDEAIDYFDLDASYDETKEELERDGYTCK